MPPKFMTRASRLSAHRPNDWQQTLRRSFTARCLMAVSCCWLGMAQSLVAQSVAAQVGGLQSPELGYVERSSVPTRLATPGVELPQPFAPSSVIPQPLPPAAAQLKPITQPNQSTLQQPTQFAGVQTAPRSTATPAWRSAEIGEAPLAAAERIHFAFNGSNPTSLAVAR